VRQLGTCLAGNYQDSANCLEVAQVVSLRMIEVTMKPLNRTRIGNEVEEELSFHLEQLTQEHLQLNMSLEEARAAALDRFGDVDQIKHQCVEISRRSHPLLLVLKVFLILVFLGGVLLRVFAIENNVRHLADVLIALGVFGRLWVYARGLSPSSFLSPPETDTTLVLTDKPDMSFGTYDRMKRTPVERIISR
jgi:hypothetical protein